MLRYLSLLLVSLSFTAQSQVISSGDCLSFPDSIPGRVAIPNSNLSYLQPPFGITAWVRLDSLVGIAPLYESSSSSYQNGYGKWIVYFETFPDGSVDLVSQLGDVPPIPGPRGRTVMRLDVDGIHDDWVHIAVFMDTLDHGAIYINGNPMWPTLVTSSSISGYRAPFNGTPSIGRGSVDTSGMDQYFQGDIDEFTVWSTYRSESEIQNKICERLDGNEPGLELYYTFEEPLNNIVDHGPNGYNGSTLGSAIRKTSSAPIGYRSRHLYVQGSVSITNNLGETLTADNPLPSVRFNQAGVHVYYTLAAPDIGYIDASNCDSVGIFGRFMATLPGINNAGGAFQFSPQPGLLATRDTANSGRWRIDSIFTSFGSGELFQEWYLFSRLPSQPDLGPDSAFCYNDSLSLGFSQQWWSNASNVSSLVWSDGSTDSSLVVNTAGDYWVEVFSGYCSLVDSISVFEVPEADSIYWDTLDICFDIGATLELPDFYPASFVRETNWSTGESSSSIFVQDTGQYILEIVSECQTFYLIYDVNLDQACAPISVSLEIPTVLTPNDDGQNDRFTIEASALSEYRITIYDRWGRSVFSGNKNSSSWDGKVNGRTVSEGVYFFVLLGTSTDGQPVQENGSIHVFH